jgi:mono/diheme cytochrome c family protein
MAMVNCKREITSAVLVLSFAGLACAQENLDSGKTGAQLYASNCAICHKTPQRLGRGGMFGLSGFLREHYTASRETAAAIAAYIESTSRAAVPGKRIGPAARTAKGGDKTKKPGVKTNDTNPTNTKSQATTVEAKPADAKPADAKPADAKPSEAKASEPKTETTPAAKPDEPKKPD